MFRFLLAAFLAIAIPLQGPILAREQASVPTAPAPETGWPFPETDLPVDPAYRFGVLDNGMRYIIRPNGTPAGQGMVQFWVHGGSLDEKEDELGFAHFIEHMAFNGSANVPEGEMIRLLEREGLAFGADTNASTGFDTTLYKLDLPRNDPALLDTALMLMRETASNLTFDPEAVEREKGVVLSEMRVRDTYSMRSTLDAFKFIYPDARFPNRLPIGTQETLENATAEGLRSLWRRIYRPDNTAVIVIGDFDADEVEAAIRDHFADWQPLRKVPQPAAGPIDPDLQGQTRIYIDPALAERITVSRMGPWQEKVDSLAFRKQNVRRQLGYQIINRRLQRLTRMEDPPFRSASLVTGEAFEAGRTTNLVVDAGDGEWRRALAAAQAEYRRALEFGFSDAEVAEQLANLRTALENNAAGADTRNNASFVIAALTLLEDEQVPTTPASALARFEAHLPEITPENVLASLQEELVPLDNPMIRFEGRTPPEGSEEALRAAWNEGMKAELAPEDAAEFADFAYGEFGPPGMVLSDEREGLLGIRKIVFANGLKLNLKPTDLQNDRVSVQLNIDGGELLNTAEDPLATAMVNVLPLGGLAKHSIDELQSILAGRSVGFSMIADEDRFRLSATTTPRDLDLQLELFAAAISDPGYRPEGEAQYQRNIANFFARRTATPENALSNELGRIISDGDPRFTLQPQEAYQDLSYARLRDVITDRLASGAMELAIVGDFHEDEVIGMVARTLGALPPREGEFRTYDQARQRSFTADRSEYVLYHDGKADQAVLRMTWPTTDDRDFRELLRLELLERVIRLELTDKLREQLGQTYSPGVAADQSRTYPGYGTFAIAASLDVADVDAARQAILETIGDMIAAPVDEDVILRARQPLLETYDNALKTNAGWMSLVDRAQTEPERLERFLSGKETLSSITGEDIRAAAEQYLQPHERVEIVVLPRQAGDKTAQ
ncbi:zinc protease [Altererythrobacter atlanticus]|uniref:Protease 3 n=1 Tax=Croceibacterium atlanticum TaxID=1267766 RepID=A0A0F7KTH2_9SPHN|nr:insulinase family protein [Croceibacterium atlanticum]AKH42100.1 Protease 3 precursor [Croceibacterium atlanticum]MBB5733330.1 zinc protease [Croceibacterium atlanticum]